MENDTIVTMSGRGKLDAALVIHKMLRKRKALKRSAIWLRNSKIIFNFIESKIIIRRNEMYNSDISAKSETGGGIQECRRPRNGITMNATLVNYDGNNIVAFVIDEIFYHDEEVALEVFNKKMLKLKGEWKNWLAKNTE